MSHTTQAYDHGYNAGYEYAVGICFGSAYPSEMYGTAEESNAFWNGVEDAIADVEAFDASL